jgi:serine protease Do
MARGMNGSANGSSQFHGDERGVEARRPGGESNLPPEVVDVLPAVVGVHATVPEDRRSAQTLGAEREGHGIVIDDDGLVVTIGYLITEASAITITNNDGDALPASIVGYDYESGFGLIRTRRPFPDVKPMPFGDSDKLALRSEGYVVGVVGE